MQHHGEMQAIAVAKVIAEVKTLQDYSSFIPICSSVNQHVGHESQQPHKSVGLLACLIGRCCSCFCSWLVLVSLFSCCAFLLRLNQGKPPSPSTSTVLVLVLALVLPTTAAITTTAAAATATALLLLLLLLLLPQVMVKAHGR